MSEKIKLNFDDVEVDDVDEIPGGEAITVNEFESHFENVDDVFVKLIDEIVLAAVITREYVYFITLNQPPPPFHKIYTLSVIRAKRES